MKLHAPSASRHAHRFASSSISVRLLIPILMLLAPLLGRGAEAPAPSAQSKTVGATRPGGFTIDSASGYFHNSSGKIITPVGVNYWPGSCGVEMWVAWPEAEIKHDLDLVRSLGLNCVRFFLRWQDFEPEPGVYNEEAFRRLASLLRWHHERGLMAHPSFFVGWMSGGVFWPKWRQGRNIFEDAEMRRRAVAFAEKAARVCAEFPDTVIAIDQGNELVCLDDSIEAKPANVVSWCADVSAAIKRGFPGVLVVSGNEQNQIVSDHGWRLDQQPGCDFLSMHAYPIGTWHPVNFNGLTDPLGQSLLPFYVKCARAFAPVMLQEFGTLLTRGEQECDSYLRAMLPAARAAGANGFLYWCLRDITATGHPYDKNAFEGSLGLVDAHDQVKPGFRYYLEFAATLQNQPAPAPAEADVALYWPREYYARDNPFNPGNEAHALSRQLAVANFTLTQLGHSVGIVRGDQPLGSSTTLVIAGAKLTAKEVAALTAWVRQGGHVIWHGPDAMTWGSGLENLLGAEPIDFRAANPRLFESFGSSWTATRFPRDVYLRVRLRDATLAANDNDGNPILFVHKLGKGTVVTCLAEMDAQFADRSIYPGERETWKRWYENVLKLAAAK